MDTNKSKLNSERGVWLEEWDVIKFNENKNQTGI